MIPWIGGWEGHYCQNKLAIFHWVLLANCKRGAHLSSEIRDRCRYQESKTYLLLCKQNTSNLLKPLDLPKFPCQPWFTSAHIPGLWESFFPGKQMLLKREAYTIFCLPDDISDFSPRLRGPCSGPWVVGEGESGEDATWLTGSSCSPEQRERTAGSNTKGKGRETMRFFKGNFPHQQNMDAGSQVAIRQNPSVL